MEAKARATADRRRDLGRIVNDWRGERTVYTWFGGAGFAVRGDVEPLLRLYRLEGFTAARLTRRDDGDFTLTGHEVTLYKDPETDRYLDRWTNPLTGHDVQVKPGLAALDMPPQSAWLPWFDTGDKVVAILERHAGSPDRPHRDSSSQQFVVSAAELADDGRASVHFVGTWQRAHGWLPWMEMGDRPGYVFSRLFMRKYVDRAALPPALLSAVRSRLPRALEPVSP